MDGDHVAPDAPPSDISGFYGPGSTISWLLIVGATLLTAMRDIRATYPSTKASTFLVAELVATLFYPLVAAGDLASKLADRSRDWPAIRSVLTPPFGWVFNGLDEGSADRRHPEWDAPPSEALVSQCMGLVLPLSIVQMGAGLIFVMYFACLVFPRRRRRVYQLGFLASWMALVLLAIVAINMATTHPLGYMLDFLLYVYLSFATQVMVPFCTIPACLFFPCFSYACFSTLFVECRQALRRPSWRDFTKRGLRQGAKRFFIISVCFWFGIITFSGPIISLYVILPQLLSGTFMANVPYSLSELDQWAALCSGAFTLAFSAYEAIPWRALVVGYVDIWRFLLATKWTQPKQDYTNDKMDGLEAARSE